MPMRSIALFGQYFLWHYSRGFADLAGVYTNTLWFVYHFFSIPTLLATFFEPFQRVEEGFGRGFDPEDAAGVLTVNIIMRLVGMAARSALILAGLVMLVVFAVGGLVFFAVWMFMPLIVLGLFLAGLSLLLFP